MRRRIGAHPLAISHILADEAERLLFQNCNLQLFREEE